MSCVTSVCVCLCACVTTDVCVRVCSRVDVGVTSILVLIYINKFIFNQSSIKVFNSINQLSFAFNSLYYQIPRRTIETEDFSVEPSRRFIKRVATSDTFVLPQVKRSARAVPCSGQV